MKRLFYLLIIAGLFASCGGNESDQDAANNKPLDQSQALISQFKPIVSGVWVKKNYIKKLIKSKSPLAAADRATGLTTMLIDTAKLKGDSIIVAAGWNNHEGSNLTLRFQPGKNTTTIELGDDELSYKIKNGDTTLVVYHYDEKTKETSTTNYIKALNTQPANNLGYGMSYMINKGIISGIYQATDNTGKKFNAVFYDNGKVSGFPDFNTYYVENDLGNGPMSNLDELIFELNGKNQKSYAFIINKRKLDLYTTKANADSSELLLDKVAFKLVKKD
ncbi:hypothetical protein FFF34_017980 [Inquilinus sp. KBS0705]|nr:hypothetical protein FFF34_017980 [Inquilinus sp. KBS0705]